MIEVIRNLGYYLIIATEDERVLAVDRHTGESIELEIVKPGLPY